MRKGIRNTIAIGAVVIVGVGASILLMQRSGTGSGAYQLAAVRRGAVSATAVGVGNLAPASQAEVVPPVSGTVASLDVHIGQHVSKGATLATVNPSTKTSKSLQTEESALAQAETALAEAEDPSQASTTQTSPAQQERLKGRSQTGTSQALSSLCSHPDAAQRQACSTLEAAIGSSRNGTTTTAQPTQSVSPTTVADDQAIVSADEAQITALTTSNVASLVAPISGTVANVTIGTGEQISADSASQSITIIAAGEVLDSVPVSLSQAANIHSGDQAKVEPVDSQQIYRGTVESVGTTPTTSSTTGLTTVVITVRLKSTRFSTYDGLQTITTFVCDHVGDTLEVPTSAITHLGGRTLVKVLEQGMVRPVVISIGVSGSIDTQVTKGLHVGQQVVLATLDAPLPTTTSIAGGFGGGRAFRGGAGAFRGGEQPGGIAAGGGSHSS